MANGNSRNDADNGDDTDEEDVFLKIERNDPNLTHLEVKQTSEGYRFHEGLYLLQMTGRSSGVQLVITQM